MMKWFSRILNKKCMKGAQMNISMLRKQKMNIKIRRSCWIAEEMKWSTVSYFSSSSFQLHRSRVEVLLTPTKKKLTWQAWQQRHYSHDLLHIFHVICCTRLEATHERKDITKNWIEWHLSLSWTCSTVLLCCRFDAKSSGKKHFNASHIKLHDDGRGEGEIGIEQKQNNSSESTLETCCTFSFANKLRIGYFSFTKKKRLRNHRSARAKSLHSQRSLVSRGGGVVYSIGVNTEEQRKITTAGPSVGAECVWMICQWSSLVLWMKSLNQMY